MRNQAWYVVALIGVMCLVRFGLGAIAYIDPPWLMDQFGAPVTANPQMPYVVRVWAIRDMVLAGLVLASSPEALMGLLGACVIIDAADILSAQLSGAAGLFSGAETVTLQTTAIAALVPELAALGILLVQKRQGAKT